MKTEPNDQDVLRAYDWYAQHAEHVDEMVHLTNSEFPPSGSDCHHPPLWKAGHWKWLLTRRSIEILTKEIWRLKNLLKTIHESCDFMPPIVVGKEIWVRVVVDELK